MSGDKRVVVVERHSATVVQAVKQGPSGPAIATQARGLKLALVAGEAIPAGQAGCLVDGKVWRASAGIGGQLCDVLAEAAVSANAQADFLLFGVVTNTGWAWDTDADKTTLYLGVSPGTFTQTAPTDSGQRVQIVGRVVSSTQMLFKPDSTSLTW